MATVFDKTINNTCFEYMGNAKDTTKKNILRRNDKNMEKYLFLAYGNNKKVTNKNACFEFMGTARIEKKERSSFYSEINNRETFNRILNIYTNNQDIFDLEFSFISSGFASLKKKLIYI